MMAIQMRSIWRYYGCRLRGALVSMDGTTRDNTVGIFIPRYALKPLYERAVSG